MVEKVINSPQLTSERRQSRSRVSYQSAVLRAARGADFTDSERFRVVGKMLIWRTEMLRSQVVISHSGDSQTTTKIALDDSNAFLKAAISGDYHDFKKSLKTSDTGSASDKAGDWVTEAAGSTFPHVINSLVIGLSRFVAELPDAGLGLGSVLDPERDAQDIQVLARILE